MTLDRETEQQLSRLSLERGRPLIAVDADEVLVYFLRHFRDHVSQNGWTLDLSTKRLDTSLRHDASGQTATRDQGWAMLEAFFRDQTHAQAPIPGAVETLERFSDTAQIVVLTNLPHFAREDRMRNLADHGHRWPIITNSGGKGRALARLQAMADAPVIFIDDSANQHESAQKHASDVRRLQLLGCAWAAPYLTHAPEAEEVVFDWTAAERFLETALE